MKTINVFKKVFISAIVLAMVMAFAFSFNKANVKAEESVIDLEITGVGIRTAGNQGIRFKVSFDGAQPDLGGVAIAYGETKETIQLDSTINGKTVLDGSTLDIDYGNKFYCITLYNIPLDQCMQNITVVPYARISASYFYGSSKVVNLSTIAYKAMNDGITSSLLTDVDTYMNANYKKVYVDEFDNLVFDGFKETNPRVLKEQFINDLNQYTNTTLTTDSIILDWASQLQNDTTITDSKIYQAYNNTKFNNKWSWLLTYLTSKNNSSVTREINELNSNNPTLSALGFITLISSLYNFFNCDGVNTWEGILFNTESAYADLTTSNIYPEIEDYDIRKNGTSLALGHEDGVLGYTVNKWKINSTEYSTTATYTTPSSNKKLTCSSKTCHVIYDINDNQVTITGLNEDVDVTDLVILSKYEGYPATSIEDYAFIYCDFLTSVIISDSVTIIGDFAFSSCTSLTSITIAASVINIGDYAFSGCESLTSITIPSSVKTIGDAAFDSCASLTSMIIPDSVTILETHVFDRCTSLKSITIPNGVTTIESSTFFMCTSLTSIVIPASLTSISSNAFSRCDNLVNIKVDSNNNVYDSRDNCNAIIETSTNTLVLGCKNTTIPNTVTCIGDLAFYYCTSLTTIAIPNSITTLGNKAFYNCKSLTSIIIPDSVTSIGNETFRFCEKLTSIVIPKNLENIGYWTFMGCIALASVEVDSDNKVFDSRNNCNAIIETSTNTLIFGCKNTIIPNTVTCIGGSSFSNVEGLTSITIPSSVTCIESWAFNGCTALTSVIIPNSVIEIREYAFHYCLTLTSIVIPSSVATMGKYVFYECPNLTINCEGASKPSGWDTNWNPKNRPVNWGYTEQ